MASQLREVMDRQRRLFHDVSHELRSPLARLQAAVGLARQQPETMRASLDRIEHEGERIDTLIGELLTLSKLEAGVIVSMDQDIDVNELVTEVIADARFEANANSRVIVFDERCTVVVKGQWELLHRAVENIVRNALKHTQQHIHVRLDIATDANGSKAHIVVTDEGPGVPEQELTEIFAPFFRSAGSTHTYGHGLGLAIARRVAEAHGGTINASNCTAGGLRVEMVLPIKNKLSIASLACGSSSVLSA
jgi:two-component system OmpR family sensor kinase